MLFGSTQQGPGAAFGNLRHAPRMRKLLLARAGRQPSGSASTMGDKVRHAAAATMNNGQTVVAV